MRQVQDVWVLVIKQGIGFGQPVAVSVWYDYQEAREGLFHYVEHWWPVNIGRDVPMPNTRSAAITRYFVLALLRGEEYSLTHHIIM